MALYLKFSHEILRGLCLATSVRKICEGYAVSIKRRLFVIKGAFACGAFGTVDDSYV